MFTFQDEQYGNEFTSPMFTFQDEQYGNEFTSPTVTFNNKGYGMSLLVPQSHSKMSSMGMSLLAPLTFHNEGYENEFITSGSSVTAFSVGSERRFLVCTLSPLVVIKR